MRFEAQTFPRYGELNPLERLFLRTCCYYPPRPKREVVSESLRSIKEYRRLYSEAFGKDFWNCVHGRRALDVGCGEGGYVLALASAGAAEAVGVDIQDHFYHAQKLALERRMRNVVFVNGRLQELPSAIYDVVVSHDSFEHFADPVGMLKEMLRTTSDDGQIFIKFGPPWRSPWGRHLSGTIRKDRPWIHLFIPERLVMRCHSVYHNKPTLLERYDQLPGGLNRMTVGRFRQIIRRSGAIIERFQVFPLWSWPVISRLPLVGEFFTSGVSVRIRKRS